MAQNLISAGVFTNEVDQSFLVAGIQQIGAAIVGPTVKGPALVPTQITTFNQFQQVFGTYTDDSYLPYVVQNYLANGGNVITVTRVQPVITTQRSLALKRRIGVSKPLLNGLSAKKSFPNLPVMPSDPPRNSLKVADLAICLTISAAAIVTMAR